MTLEALIASIAPLDQRAMAAARRRQARLTKPPGSLGRLEELSVQMAGIIGDERPILGKGWSSWRPPTTGSLPKG